MPSAAILAGGTASRFGGRDKSALVVGGRTILARQVAELAQAADDIMVVGGCETAATRTVEGLIVRLVPDRAPGNGPLAGLDAALAAARDESVLVVACDMPLITASLAAHLIALASAGVGAAIVVPATRRGYHPLFAVYGKACQTRVAAHLAARRLAMKDLVNAMSTSGETVRVVTERELEAFGDPARLLANVNTPSEYEELEALQGHQR